MGDKSGTIAFIGPTKFALGEWIGVVLDTAAGGWTGIIWSIRAFQVKMTAPLMAFDIFRYCINRVPSKLAFPVHPTTRSLCKSG